MTDAELLIDGPKRARRTVILAHGAGATMDSDFMQAIADGLAKAKVRVVRFEFPYMRAGRVSGKKPGPDREPTLRASWHQVIEHVGSVDELVIGGKSMGGRMASLVADEAGVAGLLCLGYPFHPPGRPEKTRTDHLETLTTPSLIVQGTRDPFGKPDEVSSYALAKSIQVHWVEDGDHSLKPRKSSGRTESDTIAEAVEQAVAFIAAL